MRARTRLRKNIEPFSMTSPSPTPMLPFATFSAVDITLDCNLNAGQLLCATRLTYHVLRASLPAACTAGIFACSLCHALPAYSSYCTHPAYSSYCKHPAYSSYCTHLAYGNWSWQLQPQATGMMPVVRMGHCRKTYSRQCGWAEITKPPAGNTTASRIP